MAVRRFGAVWSTIVFTHFAQMIIHAHIPTHTHKRARSSIVDMREGARARRGPAQVQRQISTSILSTQSR